MNRPEGPDQRPGGRAREPRGAAGAGDPPGIPMGSLGAWLRAQREARGVSLRDIAEASKISLRHLEALERDRFDALPAPVFVRGFLREYGRIVGLDVDEVVNVYLLAAEAARPAQEVRREAAAAQASPRRRTRAALYGALAAGLVVVVLGVAAALSYWLGRSRSEPVPGAEEVTSSPPAEPATPGDGAGAPEPAPAEPAEPQAPADAGEAGADAAAGAEAVPVAPSSAPWLPEVRAEPPAESAPGAAPAPLRVVLEFQQDCWVEVVVDGRRRESELKAGGETWAIEASDSVVLTLGNAPAVRVEVDGRPLDLPMDGRVVREFRIDRASGRALAPEPGAGRGPAEPAGT